MSSGTVAVWAMKDGDYEPTEFAGTTVGLQAAIDYLAGGKGKVFVGPGELQTTTAIWTHSYCHLQGSGRGITVIKRASGSITDGDAANSGCVVGTSAYGANGTLSSSSAIQYDITISDITLDGNSSAFGALTSGTPHQAGILAQSVDGLICDRVEVKNTLRSGFMIGQSKDVVCRGCRADTTGQFSVVTTRNAFDFYNFGAGTSGHGVNFLLDNFEVYNCGDEAISLTAVSDVSISNGYIDTADNALEMQGDSVPTSVNRISMTNVVAKNLLTPFVAFIQQSGSVFSDITISGCSFIGHATLHDTKAVAMAFNTAGYVQDLLVSNCTFRNINTLDSTATNWVEVYHSGSGTHRRIKYANCTFYGKASASATNYGCVVAGNADDVLFDGVTVYDCKANAFVCWGIAASTTVSKNVRYSNCKAENIGNHGWFVGATTVNTTIKDIRIDQCEVLDAGLVTASSVAFAFQNTAAGSTTRCYVTDCRARKVSAANLATGFYVADGGGTMDTIYCSGLDAADLASLVARTGTPTNIRFEPRVGLGTSITAAATITIPADGTVFHVTGSTNITNGITVNVWDKGRRATLIFDSTPTVSDTGTSKLAGDLIATADDTLTLHCDGTNWYEVARSVN